MTDYENKYIDFVLVTVEHTSKGLNLSKGYDLVYQNLIKRGMNYSDVKTGVKKTILQGVYHKSC